MVFDWLIVAQILWTAMATSTSMVLFSMAFALVLKVVRLFNFAQAGIMSAGFYAAYVPIQEVGLPLWAGVLGGLTGALTVSFLLEYFGFRILRMKKSSVFSFFIFSLIFSEFVSYVSMLVFGTWPKTVLPTIYWPADIVGGIAISSWDLPAIGTTVALVVGLNLLFRFTRQGQFMVAVSDNPDLAELYGINKQRVFMTAMLLAAVLVSAGMLLYGTRSQVHPTTTLELMVFAVAATILGGIGSVTGAAIAAVGLSIIQSMSILFIPSHWQGFLLYGFLFFAIIFLPNGMRLPRRLKVGVGTRELTDDSGFGGGGPDDGGNTRPGPESQTGTMAPPKP